MDLVPYRMMSDVLWKSCGSRLLVQNGPLSHDERQWIDGGSAIDVVLLVGVQ